MEKKTQDVTNIRDMREAKKTVRETEKENKLIYAIWRIAYKVIQFFREFISENRWVQWWKYTKICKQKLRWHGKFLFSFNNFFFCSE